MISGRGPADPVLPEDEQLLTFPYIIVRVECAVCNKQRRYRLARLAEEFGSSITMNRLLDKLTVNCAWRRDGQDYNGRPKPRNCEQRCGVRYTDLGDSRPPPDLPPAPARRLHVVPKAEFDFASSDRERERKRRMLRS